MKKFVALLLVLFVCLPVVAACSTLQGDNDKGATISMYLTDFPQTLDPAAVQLQADTAMIFSLIYQPLTTIDEKGKVKPGLAYEWYSYYDNRDEEYKMYFKLNETMWSDGICFRFSFWIFTAFPFPPTTLSMLGSASSAPIPKAPMLRFFSR